MKSQPNIIWLTLANKNVHLNCRNLRSIVVWKYPKVGMIVSNVVLNSEMFVGSLLEVKFGKSEIPQAV